MMLNTATHRVPSVGEVPYHGGLTQVLESGYAHEHITHYTRRSLADVIKASGFEVLDCQYVGYSEMIFKARKPANGQRTNAVMSSGLPDSP